MKAVIFDMDGTILDTLEDLSGSVNYALHANGLPKRSNEEIRTYLGKGMVWLIHCAVPEGTDEALEAKVLADHKAYYPQHCAEQTQPYPGILDILRGLKSAGVKTAVVSNKSDANVKKLVDDYFAGLFDVAVGAREGVPRKPAPELLEIALKELAVNAEDTVYVGDSDVDVETARNASLPMITVLWGFRDRKELVAAGAECFAEDADSLKKQLQKGIIGKIL